MRSRSNIDLDWAFALGEEPAAVGTEFNDTSWRRLDLPHDWSIEATPDPQSPARAGGGFFPGGIGWYRKRLELPADLGDRRVLLEFDGVYRNSEVWCNGRFCGGRPYGYSSFCYDITPYLIPGQSPVIAVRVDNSRMPNSRWYSGSGIYRHVWLTIASPVRVGHWGTYVTTPQVSAEHASVRCVTTLVNDSPAVAGVEVVATVLESPAVSAVSTSLKVPDTGSVSGDLNLVIPSPKLWSPDSPNLYTMRVEVRQNGQVIDRYDTRFGVRSLRFDANTGFFLNGKSMKLQGVNEHHDAGCLGAAIPDDVLRRRLGILKAMGCNAIRTAHNPASPTLLDLCDEIGFMVVEEAFDEWRDGKTPFGYQLDWDLWWERDLSDMIRRDRNHPSIVLWSVGNEIKEVRQGRPEGLQIMAALRDVCHREDPTRPMTCGCCNSRETLAAGYGPLMDVFGYNGGGGGCFDYEKDHVRFPNMPMIATEVPHSLQTRGVYRTRSWYRDLARNPNVERLEVPHLTDEELFTQFDDHYQSSYDNAMVRISCIDAWRRTSTLPWFCGEFRWTGFDYLGECYGWPAKSWNFGIFDLCGFPKDSYFLYKSQWTTKPMVHLLPHWTWPGLEGKAIPVICYTNCDRVELFLSGMSLGVKDRDDKAMYVRWDVPYHPGVLRVVAYRNGKEVATCEHHTAGAPAAIKLTPDETLVRADRTGVAHVAVSVVDAKGHLVPSVHLPVTFSVQGAGRLIGLENGDPLDTTNYKLNTRRTFFGRMLAIVQAGDAEGIITVSGKADYLQSGTCRIEVRKPSGR